MVYLGSAELISAVSNIGGLEVIGTRGSPSAWLEEQIDLARMLTNNPFGVNIMLMSPFVEEIMEGILKENIPIVAIGGGSPGPD
jgi:enoyl-[acyl-carrier protein] reductase II